MLDNTYKTKPAVSASAAETPKGDRRNGASDGSPLARGTYVPPEAEAVDIFKLLEQLEELPEKCTHLPFNTLLGFDKEQFYYLVLKVRANLPDDMKKAQRVARDSERIVDEARDAATQQLDSCRAEATKLMEQSRAESVAILDQARAEANRITEQARGRASQMVEQSEIHKMATSQAHEMIRRSETEANEIRKGADEYARDVLANLETVMGKAIVTVQRGRETLEKART